jgi:2-keto-4-pentenoate hydratase/2-oxohepta-3-ene-1,7-dioic acid hydratase in catechol pathway
MELWIEGEREPRQKSNTGKMIYSFQELIEYWSQVTLEPGDMIASGTPSGVAAFRKPDPGPWYLRPGQVVIAKVEKLGELRTPIR